MAKPEIKKPDSPDEAPPLVDKGKAASSSPGKRWAAVFEPGWKGSEHVKPIAGTESCQSSHTRYLISGDSTS